ncbi:MAG TPA: hypothetical protein ENI95_02360 [Chloroflexi bacterium]|nr:hypothetical protein [Chloroflexota bacterium]
MFERNDLEVLAEYQGEHPVVSLYLNLDPRLRGTPDAYFANLKSLLKKVNGRASEEDIAAIEEFFEMEFDWSGRGVAVFSCQAEELWESYRFAVPVHSYVHVSNRPFITPLVTLLDTYGSYTVALVDQQTIRMFHFHLGEEVASETVKGEEVHRLKAGGGSETGRTRGEDFQGTVREIVRSNFRTFAKALETFCRRHGGVEHLLLGGTETTVAQFKGMLSQKLQDCLQGTFNISMQAPDKEVLERSLEVMLSREEAREHELAETILMLAARDSSAVVGLEPTLEAIEMGRVQTLALVNGFLDPEVADQAIARTIEYGGQVEILDEDSPLAEAGGIGALLRY